MKKNDIIVAPKAKLPFNTFSKTVAMVSNQTGLVENIVVVHSDDDQPPANYSFVDVPEGTHIELHKTGWNQQQGFYKKV